MGTVTTLHTKWALSERSLELTKALEMLLIAASFYQLLQFDINLHLRLRIMSFAVPLLAEGLELRADYFQLVGRGFVPFDEFEWIASGRAVLADEAIQHWLDQPSEIRS